MISKPKYTTYNIYIRDESKDPHVSQQHILEGLTIRILIPDTTEKYRIPHEIASDIETELQTYMLTEKERQQAKQVEKTDYNKGLDDAWEAARKIILRAELGGYDYDEITHIFNTADVQEILKHLSPAEAIAKIKAYEDEQQGIEQAIKVGDEVVKNDYISKCGVVTYTKLTGCGNLYNVLWDDGRSCGYYKKEIKKTGRHFPQIKELLKAMKGGKS